MGWTASSEDSTEHSLTINSPRIKRDNESSSSSLTKNGMLRTSTTPSDPEKPPKTQSALSTTKTLPVSSDPTEMPIKMKTLSRMSYVTEKLANDTIRFTQTPSRMK